MTFITFLIGGLRLPKNSHSKVTIATESTEIGPFLRDDQSFDDAPGHMYKEPTYIHPHPHCTHIPKHTHTQTHHLHHKKPVKILWQLSKQFLCLVEVTTGTKLDAFTMDETKTRTSTYRKAARIMAI